MTFSDWLNKNGYDEPRLDAQQRRHLEAAWKAELPFGDLPNGQTREQGIAGLVAKYVGRGVSAEKESELRALGERAIAEGWNLKQTDLELLREERKLGPMVTSPRPASADFAAVLSTSFAMSCGASEAGLAAVLKSETEPYVAEAVMNRALEKANRHLSFHGLIRGILAAHGRHVPHGRITDNHLREVFALARQEQMSYQDHYGFSAEGPSTISLPGILADAMRKISLTAFNSAAATWNRFCATKDLADFREHTSLRLIGGGTFQKVPAGGEIKHGSLTDFSAPLQGDTYAELLAVDRKDLINDDLGKFNEIPALLGRNSALLVERSVYTLLLANSGGGASDFFGTDNGNYLSGGGSALALAGLDAAFAAFLSQTDTNGDPVLIQPAVLLVPPALWSTGQNLTAPAARLIAGTATGTQPDNSPFAGMFQVVTSAYLSEDLGLSNASDKAWFLLAGPGDFAVVQVGFLGGKAAPTIESSSMDFDRLGLSIRGYIDFGCATLEPKGGVLNAGQ